jgi:hypothetical protein
MIRGGLEFGLGIYVTGVDKDSVADRAGLMVCLCLIILIQQHNFECVNLIAGWRPNHRS